MADLFIPERLEDLTPEWLTRVLRERGVLKTARVTGARQQLLGEGEGFVGVLARLILELEPQEDGAPRTLIAKLPTPIAQNRAMGELLGAYEREILFYEELADKLPLRAPTPYYTALDRDRASERQEQIIGLVDRLPLWLLRRAMALSVRIAGRKTRRYVLLMEDLGGSRQGDQVAGGGVEDCRRALIAVARMHAAFWESRLLDGRFYLTKQDLSCRTRHLMYLDARADFERRFSALFPLGLDRLAAWLGDHGAEVARRLHGDAPQTLLHGDFRLDNLFFDDTNPTDPTVVIDWQLAGRGCAAYDVAYLISGALPVDVSRADERALLAAYHDALVAGGVKDYDAARFELDYARALLCVLQVVATTDTMEMGDDRGVRLIERWAERLLARAKDLDLARLIQ